MVDRLGLLSWVFFSSEDKVVYPSQNPANFNTISQMRTVVVLGVCHRRYKPFW